MLCLGLMFSLAVDRLQGESLISYFKKPQAVVALLFGLCAMVGSINVLAAH